MEYATRFNELSRFAPHQVDTEERRMDHFEQGLRGDIRAMIAGQTFANFQEMYQRAVKIARVLVESRLEKQTLEAGKRKIGQPGRGFPSYKRSRYDNYPGKGKQPVEGGDSRCQEC